MTASIISGARFLGIGFLVAVTAPHAFAQLPNAWQISDNSTAGSSLLGYSTNLTAAQRIAATNSGFRYAMVSRLTRDFGSASPAMFFIFGDGARRYGVGWDLNSSGHLVVSLLGSNSVTVATDPVGATNYHLHELIYDPATTNVTYRFDGAVVATWSGQASTAQSGQARWGGTSSADRGEMNFHQVQFEIGGLGVIAAYHAGFSGDPVVAPAPTTRGWLREAGAAFIPEGPVSPDAIGLPPLIGAGAFPFLRPGQAVLSASVNPNGQPTACWFEHGPTTSYGSFTPTNLLSGGTSFTTVSELVTGLPRGGPYHFRLVASNVTGKVVGSNVSFNVPQGTLVPSGATGGNQPFSNWQPSLELNYIICTNGSFPHRESALSSPFLGEVGLFAGNFAPAGWAFCHGQLLVMTNHLPLFSLLGTAYSGNGITTFGLPDLRGRTVTGTGWIWSLGDMYGYEGVTLSSHHLPAHTHALDVLAPTTGPAGSGIPYENQNPFLVLNCLLNTSGNYPVPGQLVNEPVISQITFFAGNYTSFGDREPAFGQLLNISMNVALFSLIGTTYGGDGNTTFAVPNLGGRALMGTGQGPGPNSWTLGQQVGSSTFTLTEAQLPAHQHAVPALNTVTGFTGGNQSRSLMSPSLALQYLIATNGAVPSASVQATNRMIGQIRPFAGSTVPGGWTPCNGQVLQIAQHPVLFAVIGAAFGGDGITTFAVPDLSSRIPVGSSNGICGAVYGAQQAALTVAEIPSHHHALPALDYDHWITAFGVSGSSAAFEVDTDGDRVPNGFEWATGTGPTNAASFVPLTITTSGDNVFLHFPRNTNATDITFLLQRTADLGVSNSWTAIVTNTAGVWFPSAVVSQTGTGNPVNVSVSDSRTNHAAASYRLRIDWP